MFDYFISRITGLIPVLLGITIFAFLIGVASPGDPAYIALTRDGVSDPSEVDILEKRQELGLDQPIHVQYARWIGRLMRGDLGTSMYNDEPIGEEIARRLPVTLKLASGSLLISVVMGLSMGSLMTSYKGKIIDKFLQTLCSLLVSIPSFWMGIICISLFAEILGWLPSSGIESWKGYILPSFVLSMGSVGVSARLSRANFLGELSKHYVLVAQAKGLKELYIGLVHVFRNALIPIVTYFGMYFAAILGGSSVIENVFALPGLGSYVIEGVFNRDYFVLQAYVLITGTVYVLMNLGIDMIYFVINPKMREGETL